MYKMNRLKHDKKLVAHMTTMDLPAQPQYPLFNAFLGMFYTIITPEFRELEEVAIEIEEEEEEENDVHESEKTVVPVPFGSDTSGNGEETERMHGPKFQVAFINSLPIHVHDSCTTSVNNTDFISSPGAIQGSSTFSSSQRRRSVVVSMLGLSEVYDNDGKSVCDSDDSSFLSDVVNAVLQGDEDNGHSITCASDSNSDCGDSQSDSTVASSGVSNEENISTDSSGSDYADDNRN